MLTAGRAEEKTLREVAELRAVGGCACSGCLAEVLGIYPVTGSDYWLHELVEQHGYPTDHEKRLLYNAVIDVCEPGRPKLLVD